MKKLKIITIILIAIGVLWIGGVCTYVSVVYCKNNDPVKTKNIESDNVSQDNNSQVKVYENIDLSEIYLVNLNGTVYNVCSQCVNNENNHYHFDCNVPEVDQELSLLEYTSYKYNYGVIESDSSIVSLVKNGDYYEITFVSYVCNFDAVYVTANKTYKVTGIKLQKVETLKSFDARNISIVKYYN